jgi:hypothetical protein
MANHIDIETQRLGITTPKFFVIISIVAGSLFGAGMAYSQLATKSFVVKRVKTVDSQLITLVDAQTETTHQMATLARRADSHDKHIHTIVKLVKIQFVEQVDERERRTTRPRSAKSRHVAKLLQVDPDDPMAGLELLESTP